MRKELFFNPWIGKNFNDGLNGKKILLLGESHYGSPKDYNENFTIDMVKKLGIDEPKAYFTKIVKIVGEYWYQPVSKNQKEEFWDSVAFSNYIQFMVNPDQGHLRPTNKMWTDSKNTLKLLEELIEPDLIFILGIELSKNANLGELETSYFVTKHPSTSIRYIDYIDTVRNFYQEN